MLVPSFKVWGGGEETYSRRESQVWMDPWVQWLHHYLLFALFQNPRVSRFLPCLSIDLLLLSIKTQVKAVSFGRRGEYYIAVYYAIFVQIGQSLQKLFHIDGYQGLWKCSKFLDDVV